jgi:nucleoside-diphosphate-sugar epimerase
VLVTGASGFIGAALCRELVERGEDVAALARRPETAPAGVRVHQGDLADASRLREILAAERPECVMHLAAEIASQRSAARVYEVNVTGTEHLIDACLACVGGSPATGPRLVFASTVVTGDARGEQLTEDRPLPVETPYGRAKQEGERLIAASGLPFAVVRPSHVYGPGGWFAHELVARLRQPGRFAVVGRGENLWDVVHVDDVVSALILAADAPSGSTYHVVDDEPIRFYDFMALTARELGVGPPRRLPVALVRLVAGRNAVDAVVRSARSSNAKIRRELGWTPRFPTAAPGVADAVARMG